MYGTWYDAEANAITDRGRLVFLSPFDSELDVSGLRILAAKMELKECGLKNHRMSHEDKPYKFSDQDLRELWELQRLLPTLFDRRYARRGTSSYGLKHICEKFIPHRYISNASTILMCTYLGILWTAYKDDGINANIRYTMKNDDQLVKSMQEYCYQIRKQTNPWALPPTP